MATSMVLPFLYQTQTICQIRLSAVRSVTRLPRTRRPWHRGFSRNPYLAEQHGRSGHRTSESDPKVRKDDSPRVDDKDQQKDENEEAGNIFHDLALDLQSENKSTPKPNKHFRRAETNGMDRERYIAPSPEVDDQEIEFEDQAHTSKSASESVEELINPRNRGASTITITERITFQRIFEDLFERTRQSNPAFSAVEDENKYVSAHAQQSTRMIEGLLEKVVPSVDAFQTEDEKRAAVARYPPALRAAAARAFGLDLTEDLTADMEESMPEPQISMSVYELDKVRQPERERVEELMRIAETDFELWDVLEKEVFPLVAKLGLDVEANTPSARFSKDDMAQTTKTSKAKKGTTKAKEKSSAAESPIEGIPALDFYGPLYPTYLLLALRLLDRSFNRPSALALALLPKIKSLGVISHVLGGSTTLYNELLRIYAFGHDNLPKVDTLLKEMLEAGLVFDEGTQAVMQDITRHRETIVSEGKGKSLAMLWQLPDWKQYDFETWSKLVNEKVWAKKTEPRVEYKENR